MNRKIALMAVLVFMFSAMFVTQAITPVKAEETLNVQTTEVWAVGEDGVIIHWDGSTWSEVQSPTSNSLLSVYMLSPTEGWAVGEQVILRWDGSAWSVQDLPPDVTINLLWSVHAISPNEAWAVGTIRRYLDGASYTSDPAVLRWDGTSWEVVPDPAEYGEFTSVYVLSANDVWVIGDVSEAGERKSVVLRWDVNTWSTTYWLPLDWLHSIHMFSPTKGWIQGDQWLWEWDGFTWLNVADLEGCPWYGGGYIIPGIEKLWLARFIQVIVDNVHTERPRLLVWNDENLSLLAIGPAEDCIVVTVYLASPEHGWLATYDGYGYGQILYWNGTSLTEVFRTRPLFSISGYRVDTTPPVTTISLSGTLGLEGWYVSDLIVTLTAIDDISGVAKTEYSFDGAAWITYTTPFTITTEGITTVYYRSTDIAGNMEATKSQTIKIDKTLPTTELTIGTHYVDDASNIYVTSATEFTLTATNAVSGVAYTCYRINYGDWVEYVATFKLMGPDGTYTIDYYSIDVAGNHETPKSATVILVSLKVDSYLTDSNFNPITYFDIVFVKDRLGGYRLVATNPGQFYYNIEITNDWPIAIDTPIIDASIPADFVLKGAVPTHVYLDGTDITNLCTTDGTIITVTNIPAGSKVCVTIHLDYALKYQYTGIIYDTLEEFGLKGCTFAVIVSGSGSAPSGILTATYTSSATLTAHQKKTTAIAGFVTDADGNPIVGATAELFDSYGNLIATTVTDENGFYYFPDIEAGDYTIKLTYNGQTYTQTTTAVSKELTQVDFKIE